MHLSAHPVYCVILHFAQGCTKVAPLLFAVFFFLFFQSNFFLEKVLSNNDSKLYTLCSVSYCSENLCAENISSFQWDWPSSFTKTEHTLPPSVRNRFWKLKIKTKITFSFCTIGFNTKNESFKQCVIWFINAWCVINVNPSAQLWIIQDRSGAIQGTKETPMWGHY